MLTSRSEWLKGEPAGFCSHNRDSGTAGGGGIVGGEKRRTGRDHSHCPRSQRAAGFGDVLPVGSSMRLVTMLPRK